MKILATSDLHGILPEIVTPFDLLLICGDICPVTNHRLEYQRYWLENDFYYWLNTLPYENTFSRVVCIAGNHDLIFERSKKDIENIMYTLPSNFVYLKHELYEFEYLEEYGLNSLKIFGTPYCTQFGNWAFMRDSNTLKEKFKSIPNNIDILISHQPPRINNLGTILEDGLLWSGNEAGSEELAEAVRRVKPKMLFCGHIHSGNHEISTIEYENSERTTMCANVSLVDEKYKPVNKVLEIEL